MMLSTHVPRVSIVTPCYNAGRFLSRTLASVKAQTFLNWEHIVVDDGSTDDSASIVLAAQLNEPRLVLVQCSNGGMSKARNYGYRYCSVLSEYVYFLDADDCPEPNFLSLLVKHMDSHKEVGLVYCEQIMVDQNDVVISNKKDKYGLYPRYIPELFWLRKLPPSRYETPFESLFCIVGTIPSAMLIRRKIFERTLGWDDDLRYVFQDTDMALQISLLSKVHFFSTGLIRYRRYDSQTSANINRYLSQKKLLYEKWLSTRWLGSSRPFGVLRAWRFYCYCYQPFVGLCAAHKHFSTGKYLLGMRFLIGAFRRFLSGFYNFIRELFSLI